MRIGFLTAEYAFGNRHRGGLGNYLRRNTLALAEAGHEPHVFYYIDEPPGIQVDQGVHIHIINSRPSNFVTQVKKLSRSKLRQTLGSLERCYRFRRYLKEALRKYPLDIIQSSSSNAPALLISDEVPVVIRASSYRPLVDKYDRIRTNIDRRIHTGLETLQYRRAAGVFTPTKFLAGILHEQLGLEKVTVIPTPFYNEVSELNDSLYNRELDGRDYLLFFGRLSPLKGSQVLASALPQVWKIHPDLVAVFIGEDRKLDRNTMMTEFIRKECAGYEHNLKFFPLISHELLYPIIKHARLVVLPTFFDNSPNTMLEAMGFGRPVVGTYGTSMDEFIEDDVSGFLVQPGDAKALAEKICEAWSRSDLTKIGEQANCVISALNPSHILPRLIEFYERHKK